MRPNVSIIVPVYNMEQYLTQCMDSVVRQTLNEIEIIIVNDGSTDSSLKICEDYKQKDPRIKLINKENGGLSSARNAGMKIATGEYIGFVDSDDFIKENMFEILYERAKTNDADIVICNSYLYDQHGAEELKPAWVNEYIQDKIYTTFEERQDLLYPCLAWLKIYRNSFLTKYNLSFAEGIIFEDNPWNMKILSHANKIVGIRDFLYFYRDRTDSIMSSLKRDSQNNKKIFDILKIIELELEFLENNQFNSEWNEICEAYIISLGLNHFNRVFKESKNDFFYQLKILFQRIKPSKLLRKHCPKLQYIQFLSIRNNSYFLYKQHERAINILRNPTIILSDLKRYTYNFICKISPLHKVLAEHTKNFSELKSLNTQLTNIVHQQETRINTINQKLDNVLKVQDHEKFLLKNTYRLLQRTAIEKDYLHSCQINGQWYQFYDTMTSVLVEYVSEEFTKNSVYDFSKIHLEEGDIVIDIGANIGMVSILLALNNPGIKVLSFEPIPRLFEYLLKNIKLYSLENSILPFNFAVSGKTSTTRMKASFVDPGGSTMFSEKEMGTSRIDAIYNNIKTISLDDIFSAHEINKCKLLKIDCEGAEYDILYETKNLTNIEYVIGEFHTFNIEVKGDKYKPENLLSYLKRKMKKPENISVKIQDKVTPWL